MNNKLQVLLSGAASGVTGFISFIANTPPSQQDQLLGSIVEIVPVMWRPQVALWMGTVSRILAFYALYRAAKLSSKPPTP